MRRDESIGPRMYAADLPLCAPSFDIAISHPLSGESNVGGGARTSGPIPGAVGESVLSGGLSATTGALSTIGGFTFGLVARSSPTIA